LIYVNTKNFIPPRHLKKWDYMAFLDPDDLIVPQQHYYMDRFVRKLEKQYGYMPSFVMLQYLFPTWLRHTNFK